MTPSKKQLRAADAAPSPVDPFNQATSTATWRTRLSWVLLKLRGESATNVDLAAMTWALMIIAVLMIVLMPHGQPVANGPVATVVSGR